MSAFHQSCRDAFRPHRPLASRRWVFTYCEITDSLTFAFSTGKLRGGRVMNVRTVAAFIALAITNATSASGVPKSVFVPGTPSAVTQDQYLTLVGHYFTRIDTFHRGYITKSQIRSFFLNSGSEYLVPFPWELVKFDCVDLNHDGKMTRAEYLNFARSISNLLIGEQGGGQSFDHTSPEYEVAVRQCKRPT